MDVVAILGAIQTAHGYITKGASVLSYLKWIYDKNNIVQMHYSKNGDTIVFTAEETNIRNFFTPPHQPVYAVHSNTNSRLNKFRIIEIIGKGDIGKDFLKLISIRFNSRGSIPQHEIVGYLTHMAEEYYNEQHSTTTTCLEKRTVAEGDSDMALLPGGSPTAEMLILKLTFNVN
jgi:hypothetical protein